MVLKLDYANNEHVCLEGKKKRETKRKMRNVPPNVRNDHLSRRTGWFAFKSKWLKWLTFLSRLFYDDEPIINLKAEKKIHRKKQNLSRHIWKVLVRTNDFFYYLLFVQQSFQIHVLKKYIKSRYCITFAFSNYTV